MSQGRNSDGPQPGSGGLSVEPTAWRENGAGSRAMLRRLRDALAAEADREERLNRIVRLIAVNMVAEVCSIYLRAADDTLELSATEGLNPDSVHRARLALGEGLVGRIAKTGRIVNTSDAANAPGFRYIPGTGEESYSSFLGVPIRRQGHTLGVLVVQNRAARVYDEDEIDALELVAMVIAEMTDAGALRAAAAADGVATGPLMLQGAASAEGVAMGRVVLYEPKIAVANPIAENIDAEVERLREAMDAVREEVDRLLSGDRVRAPGEHRDVLETFRMFAHDAGWMRRLEGAVRSGLAAEAAVEKVQQETSARLHTTADPYLRERLSDLEDLAQRLLRRLVGVAPLSPETLPDDAILLGRALGPGELLEFGRGRLKGVALEEGSAGSHAAIVARALEIPLVTNVRGLLHQADSGEPIIVDGDVGRVLLRPEGGVTGAYREKLHLREKEAQQFRAIRDKPALTRDGVKISLQMNAGLITDLPSIAESGAEGVGLYRTELQYLVNSRAPRRDAQTALYTRVLDAAGDRPVVFRTLDMGGDKRLPFLKGAAEENPALGWRAIRIALDRPLLFRMQLQALLRAGAGRALLVMFPMIAEAWEFDRARELLEIELDRAERQGREPPALMKIGAMLETPALGFAPDRFFERADFISVGGNDLMQFFFAADRGNERVRARYDPLSCALLDFLRRVVARCEAAHTPLSFCGEMAGRPEQALALAAIGFRTLSMRPAGIGPVKRLLRSVDLADARAAVNAAIDRGERDVRAALVPFLEAQKLSG